MKIFENANYSVLPISDFRLFSDLGNWKFPSADSELGNALIKLADKALEEEIPQLYATKFLEFTRVGNRANFEADYYKRREILLRLFIGEVVLDNGKYIDKIIDLVWLILEETTWHIPAHNADMSGNPNVINQPLGYQYEGKVSYIDLCSAETSSLMSFVYYFLCEKLDAVTTIIGERMVYEIRRRGIQPYIDRLDQWWRGYDRTRKPNNWNPWIASNILTCTALVESDLSVRKKIVALAMESLDFFVDGYPEDGGCNEGPGYWSHAGGALFSALEVIYDMTAGTANFFDKEIVYNMLDYIRKVHLRECRFTNFADCSAQLYKDGMNFVARMGERTANKALTDFAVANSKCHYIPSGYRFVYRILKDICYNLPEIKDYTPNKFDELKNLQVAVYRNIDGFTLAAKGGSNKESHNHNDIGQFVLMNEEKPIIIDLGAPTYTRDVFSENRYKVFPVSGMWHSVPIVNGYAQKEGSQFVCDCFEANEEKITIEYQSAYEKEAGVKKCIREIILGKDKIIINETIDFDGTEAVFQYYMIDAPERKEGNTFFFANGVKITAPQGSKIISVPVPDKKVADNWGRETLHKMVVKINKSATFGLIFER